MITLKEIAAEAGVSVMTVSNVINNKTARVSPQTAKRIWELVEKYQYEPNMAARSLISKATHIIAIFLPLWNTTVAGLLHDSYVGNLLGYMESMLREHGYYAMLYSFSTAEEALKCQRTWQVDGAILLTPHKDDVTRELVERSIAPLVVIDRRFEDIPMRSVLVDDHKGGYITTKHLLEYGHREIGFACPTIKGSEVIRERYRGYLDALGEYDLQPNHEWLFTEHFHQEGGWRIGQLIADMAHRPTAMVATEDMIACGIIRGCQDKGMKIPEDMSVVGFDDLGPASLVSPRLSTVAQSMEKKAEHAVRMVLDAIEHPRKKEDSILLDVEFVSRESVACRKE